MPASIVFFIIVALFICAIALIANNKKRSGVFLFVVAVVFSGWLISAIIQLNLVPIATKVTKHEINSVTYPNGTKQQIFLVEGKPYSITRIFQSVVDEDKWEVERNTMQNVVIWGIAFYENSQEHFALVKKKED